MRFGSLDAQHIHFVGITGVAMTALAVWAKESGFTVSGSDVAGEFPTHIVLHEAGIPITTGFSSDRYSGSHVPDIVVYSGANGGKHNPEVVAARTLGIPVFPHGQALGMAMAGKKQVSVAGSHGKTTTTAMIATILRESGSDPSYAVGSGIVKGLGSPGHAGSGDIFVAEADEYVTDPSGDRKPRFLWQLPDILVVTNIDFDHPDVYGSLADVQRAFLALRSRVSPSGWILINADDTPSNVLLNGTQGNVMTYGKDKKATARITGITQNGAGMECSLRVEGNTIPLSISIAGEHNVFNAVAAALAAYKLGIPWDGIIRGLSHFGGAARRMDRVGFIGKSVIYDDYAHHPREIIATLAALRGRYPDYTLVCVFQAHTYSRTKALMSDFGRAFVSADSVYITGIYGSARESESLGISGEILAREIELHHPRCTYVGTEEMLFKNLDRESEKSIIVFMGAGDIYGWSKRFLEYKGKTP